MDITENTVSARTHASHAHDAVVELIKHPRLPVELVPELRRAAVELLQALAAIARLPQ